MTLESWKQAINRKSLAARALAEPVAPGELDEQAIYQVASFSTEPNDPPIGVTASGTSMRRLR
jgi:hypothetical protein